MELRKYKACSDDMGVNLFNWSRSVICGNRLRLEMKVGKYFLRIMHTRP